MRKDLSGQVLVHRIHIGRIQFAPDQLLVEQQNAVSDGRESGLYNLHERVDLQEKYPIDGQIVDAAKYVEDVAVFEAKGVEILKRM